MGTTAYQSTLLAGEAFDAAATPITGDTAGDTPIDTVVARVYDLSAFSLRAGAIELPDTITGGVMLDTTVPGQEDGTVVNIEKMRPLVEDPPYISRGLCRYAVEMNQGWFDAHGIHAGDRIDLPPEIRAYPVR